MDPDFVSELQEAIVNTAQAMVVDALKFEANRYAYLKKDDLPNIFWDGINSVIRTNILELHTLVRDFIMEKMGLYNVNNKTVVCKHAVVGSCRTLKSVDIVYKSHKDPADIRSLVGLFLTFTNGSTWEIGSTSMDEMYIDNIKELEYNAGGE